MQRDAKSCKGTQTYRSPSIIVERLKMLAPNRLPNACSLREQQEQKRMEKQEQKQEKQEQKQEKQQKKEQQEVRWAAGRGSEGRCVLLRLALALWRGQLYRLADACAHELVIY